MLVSDPNLSGNPKEVEASCCSKRYKFYLKTPPFPVRIRLVPRKSLIRLKTHRWLYGWRSKARRLPEEAWCISAISGSLQAILFP